MQVASERLFGVAVPVRNLSQPLEITYLTNREKTIRSPMEAYDEKAYPRDVLSGTRLVEVFPGVCLDIISLPLLTSQGKLTLLGAGARGSMFRYEDATKLANVCSHLTLDRLEKYSAATSSLAAAVQLYAWNASASAAFYAPLQALEVGFRNALHRELSKTFSPNWYEHPRFVSMAGSEEILEQVNDARQDLQYRKAKLERNNPGTKYDLDNPPHVTAELGFGTWTRLLDPKFEPSYWSMALWRAFPKFETISGVRLHRKHIADAFHHLRTFRNRIAHHEPIFMRDLRADYSRILTVSSWMYDDVMEWIEYHSHVKETLDRKPS